jgi:hypothetical protein
MGLSGISKSQVSKLCKDIDERVNAFLDRPIDGEWPYLWLDATYPENASTPQAPRKMAPPSCFGGQAKERLTGPLRCIGRRRPVGSGGSKAAENLTTA